MILLKKACFLFTLFTAILFCSSCAEPVPEPDPINASAIWEANIEDVSFSLETTENDSDAFIRFSEPEVLKQMEVRIEDGLLHAVYDGLETEISPQFIANIYPFYQAIMTFRTSDVGQKDSGVVSGDKQFKALRDESGNYLQIEVKGNDGTHYKYAILSVTIKHDNTTRTSQDSSGPDPA